MKTFTAIDPSGKLHKRTSLNRTYLFTVVSKRSETEARLFLRAPGILAAHRSNYRYHKAWLDGTSEFLTKPPYRSDEEHAAYVERHVAEARERLEGCATADDYIEKCVQEGHARIAEGKANGHYDEWVNDGWCGRRDLAEKLAQKMRGQGRVEVTILPVKVKG